MATMKIKKNDTVKVITGKDKGKEGKVIPAADARLFVEGVNMISKHSKASQKNPKGGIIHQKRPIDVSNVSPHKGKPPELLRLWKAKRTKKVRFAKTTGDVID